MINEIEYQENGTHQHQIFSMSYTNIGTYSSVNLLLYHQAGYEHLFIQDFQGFFVLLNTWKTQTCDCWMKMKMNLMSI